MAYFIIKYADSSPDMQKKTHTRIHDKLGAKIWHEIVSGGQINCFKTLQMWLQTEKCTFLPNVLWFLNNLRKRCWILSLSNSRTHIFGGVTWCNKLKKHCMYETDGFHSWRKMWLKANREVLTNQLNSTFVYNFFRAGNIILPII